MKQILWQLINSAEVSEGKHYTQLIKTGIPLCTKGTSFEVGIPNKGLDEIYHVHNDQSSKKRKKKHSTCGNKRLYTSIFLIVSFL